MSKPRENVISESSAGLKARANTMTRRGLVQAGAAGVAGVAATAALSVSPVRQALAQGSGWQGEIVMFAQAYTPNSKLPDAVQLKAFQEVADEYQKTHPGVTIKFFDEDMPEYLQTVRVKAAGGELWDVFWGQVNELNGTLPRGIARDLAGDFAKPNPYIADVATWQDAMNKMVLAITSDPSGVRYNINGDYVGTAFFYNKALFDKAGITETPTSWAGILDVSKKLSDAGITVAEGFKDHSWFARHFLSDFYAKDFAKISGCDGSPGVSPQDQAAAVKSGLLSPKDRRYMGWWPVFKKFTDFWSQEFMSQERSAVEDQIRRNFASGKVAMMYNGSWLPNELKTTGYDFELDSFSFPILTKEDTEFAQGTDVSGVVGGPFAAYQYAMSTTDSNKTMKDAGKEAAVLDWLQYVGSPAVIEKVVNELGSFAPTWPGTKAAPGLETFVAQSNVELHAIETFSISPKLGPNLERIFGLYLSGNSDVSSTASQVQTELDMSVQDFERANPKVDLDTCTG
jgi:raffinose/stachyose/melibiose transport system substrate-binding protein